MNHFYNETLNLKAIIQFPATATSPHPTNEHYHVYCFGPVRQSKPSPQYSILNRRPSEVRRGTWALWRRSIRTSPLGANRCIASQLLTGIPVDPSLIGILSSARALCSHGHLARICASRTRIESWRAPDWIRAEVVYTATSRKVYSTISVLFVLILW